MIFEAVCLLLSFSDVCSLVWNAFVQKYRETYSLELICWLFGGLLPSNPAQLP
jgi:hypothetical protein